MLINALCDYYDILRRENKIPPDGYSYVKVSYLIHLNEAGKIVDISIPDSLDSKSNPCPQKMLFPKRMHKSATSSEFIEHRPVYIFGLKYNKETDRLTSIDSTNNAQKSHTKLVQYNLEALQGIDDPLVNAYCAFLKTWVPSAETENPQLVSLRKKIESVSFAFCLENNSERFLQDVPAVKARWEVIYAQNENDTKVACCSITGEGDRIARIHDPIQGICGGNSAGARLVCFKNDAEISYGATNSFNCNIGRSAIHKYTALLEYHATNSKNKTLFEDITVLHWAASADERYNDVAYDFLDDEREGANEVTEALDILLKNARNGIQQIDMPALLRDMDLSVSFYIVGLKPSNSRIAVKFIYRNAFADVLSNIAQHIEDMKIGLHSRPVRLKQLVHELLPPKADKKKQNSNQSIDPTLTSKLFSAVINGTMYPNWLLATLVRRIQTDINIVSGNSKSEEIRMENHIEILMRMVKACINRSARLNGEKEVISVALDRTNQNPAYLCGRLFAVLEGIQQRASNYSLNRTIKDAYFASASIHPAAIFPKLIVLAQYHLAKLGNSYFADQEIMELIASLGNEFPDMLSLKDQGIFMLGYYQQKANTQQRIKQYKEDK